MSLLLLLRNAQNAQVTLTASSTPAAVVTRNRVYALILFVSLSVFNGLLEALAGIPGSGLHASLTRQTNAAPTAKVLTAVATSAAFLVRLVSHIAAMGQASAPSVPKASSITKSTSQGSTSILTRAVNLIKLATSGPSATVQIQRILSRIFSVSQGSTPVKVLTVLHIATAAQASSVVKSLLVSLVKKPTQATSVIVTTIKVRLVLLVASASSTASVIRSIGLVKTISNSTAVTTVRNVGLVRAASSATSATITRIRTVIKALSVSASTNAVLAKISAQFKTLSVMTSISPSVVKQILLTKWASSGVFNGLLEALEPGASDAASVFKRISATKNTSSATTASVASISTLTFHSTLSAAVSGVAFLSRLVSHVASTTAHTAAVVARTRFMALVASASSTSSTIRSIGLIKTVSNSVAVTSVRAISRTLISNQAAAPTKPVAIFATKSATESTTAVLTKISAQLKTLNVSASVSPSVIKRALLTKFASSGVFNGLLEALEPGSSDAASVIKRVNVIRSASSTAVASYVSAATLTFHKALAATAVGVASLSRFVSRVTFTTTTTVALARRSIGYSKTTSTPSTASVTRLDKLTKSTTQATLARFAFGSVLVRILVASATTSALVRRAVSWTRTVAQGEGVTIKRFISTTRSVSLAALGSVTKRSAKTPATTQGTSLTLSRLVGATRTVIENTSPSIRRQISRSLVVVQITSAIVRLRAQFALSTSAILVASLNKGTRKPFSVTVGSHATRAIIAAKSISVVELTSTAISRFVSLVRSAPASVAAHLNGRLAMTLSANQPQGVRLSRFIGFVLIATKVIAPRVNKFVGRTQRATASVSARYRLVYGLVLRTVAQPITTIQRNISLVRTVVADAVVSFFWAKIPGDFRLQLIPVFIDTILYRLGLSRLSLAEGVAQTMASDDEGALVIHDRTAIISSTEDTEPLVIREGTYRKIFTMPTPIFDEEPKQRSLVLRGRKIVVHSSDDEVTKLSIVEDDSAYEIEDMEESRILIGSAD